MSMHCPDKHLRSWVWETAVGCDKTVKLIKALIFIIPFWLGIFFSYLVLTATIYKAKFSIAFNDPLKYMNSSLFALVYIHAN